MLALGTASFAAAEYQDSDFLLMVGDARPFSIYDGSLFDRKPYAPQGFGVRWTHFEWLINAGPPSTIGNTEVPPRGVFDGIFPTLEYNTATTDEMETKGHSGDRVEIVHALGGG